MFSFTSVFGKRAAAPPTPVMFKGNCTNGKQDHARMSKQINYHFSFPRLSHKSSRVHPRSVGERCVADGVWGLILFFGAAGVYI